MILETIILFHEYTDIIYWIWILLNMKLGNHNDVYTNQQK